MSWILVIIILLIIISLIDNFRNKKRLSNIEREYKSNWGLPNVNNFFDFDKIGSYFRSKNNEKDSFHYISNQIQNDLDLDEIFKYIDRTSSKIGQQYLYYKLRVIKPKDNLYKFDKLIGIFETNEKLRIRSQMTLSTLNSHNVYDLEKLINEKIIKKPSFQKYLFPLSLLSIVLIILGFFYKIFFLLLIPVFLINSVLHYKTKSFIGYYLNAINQLNRSLLASKKLSSYPEINNHFKNFDFIDDVNKIRFKTKFISFEKELNNEIAILFWLVIEIFKIQFNFESIIFYKFIDDILNKSNSIDKLFRFIGEIDSAISIASVKHNNTLICKPIFTDKKKIVVKEMMHPLIEKCVPNDINLLNKSLLLTGSNMSGKTTFIRGISINSILAQSFNFAFAKEFTIPFYKVYTSIRISDNVFDNESYYLKEVLTIKDLIDASQQKDACLFVLDEIFKGTNTIERISAGKAILSYLNNKKDFVFVSTHDIELTALLENDNFELYHFSEQVIDNKISFDHKIKKGKLKTRNAIKILELYDYPKNIIKDANNTKLRL